MDPACSRRRRQPAAFPGGAPPRDGYAGAAAGDCFVIFDRVESTDATLPKVWFLHLPSEPTVDGDTCVWGSDLAGDTGAYSMGRSWVTMQTLAPQPVRITRRGGPGQDFWGHPCNPDAQYNHTLDNQGIDQKAYRLPPLSPWRLEVEPGTRQTRDYFLHVLWLHDDPPKDAERAEPIEDGGRIGARIPLRDRLVAVRFDLTGACGGRLTIEESGEAAHDAELPREL